MDDPYVDAATAAQAQAYGQALAAQGAAPPQGVTTPLTSDNPLAGIQGAIMGKLQQKAQTGQGSNPLINANLSPSNTPQSSVSGGTDQGPSGMSLSDILGMF